MQNLKSSIPFFFIFLGIQTTSQAQQNDALNSSGKVADTSRPKTSRQISARERNFNPGALILPGCMIAYGFIAIGSDGLRDLDKQLHYEMYLEHPHHTLQTDNYLQYAPAVLAFGLDLAGIKAKHDFKDRTMLFLMSHVITNVTVSTIKKQSHQLRPDGLSYGSFPSGHTANAFSNAEFLRKEYKDVSPWYGVAGYTMAISTAYLRMYNNKHWLRDVVAGAGVGILSTNLAYWLYGGIQHAVFKNKFSNTVITPTYQEGAIGMALVHNFK